VTARITITVDTDPAVVGSTEAPVLSTCTFSNDDNTAIAGWLWEIVDKPRFSNAVLATPNAATTTLVPDLPGTYLVRLITYYDVGRLLADSSDLQGVGVRYGVALQWRLPAAHETTQFSSTGGWKDELNSILDTARTAILAASAPSWGGTGLRVLLQAIDNSFTTQRIGISEIGVAPTVTDDSGDGYLVGSWWVQLLPGEIPTPILWDCHDNTAGAAVWQQRPLASTVTPGLVARSGAIGTSAQFARADHVHDVSLVTRAVSASATIVSTDEILVTSTTGGAVILTLPNPATRRYYAVKKTTTDSNAITLRPHDTSGSGPSIEGGAAGADFALPNSTVGRGYWFFFSDGTAWWIA
jgi:hypothetical protein